MARGAADEADAADEAEAAADEAEAVGHPEFTKGGLVEGGLAIMI